MFNLNQYRSINERYKNYSDIFLTLAACIAINGSLLFGNCLIVQNDSLDWFEASNSCNAIGQKYLTRGRLANFRNLNDFVTTKEMILFDTWIGLSSVCCEFESLDSYVWRGSQQQTMSYYNSTNNINLVPFELHLTRGYCVHATANGTAFQSADCSTKKRYMCQICM